MNFLVRWHYTEMAKLIAILLFVCFEFSKQGEVAVVGKPKDILLPAEFAFPEQQILQETYPLDINFSNEKDFLKSAEGADTLSQQFRSWEIDDELYDQMWEDYVEVVLDVEEWITEANPGMSHYKWLKIVERGSVVKGTVPKCAAEVVSIYDYNDRSNEDSWLNSDDSNVKLIEEYSKLVSDIEKWMMKANPEMSDYKWLKALERGTEASCVDYDAESYDYYYDTDAKTFFGGKESYKKKLPPSRKLKFKRFTSV